MNKIFLTVFALMLLASGCASVTKDIMVETHADPKTSFANYTSYT